MMMFNSLGAFILAYVFRCFIFSSQLCQFISCTSSYSESAAVLNKDQQSDKLTVVTYLDNHQYNRSSVLLIDVDNCLYNEKQLKSNGVRGIEEQIVHNIHQFGAKYFNLTPEILEEMHQYHGSTVEGLRYTMIHRGDTDEDIQRTLHQFYTDVYQNIDVTSLLQTSSEKDQNTGYDHNLGRRWMKSLASQLTALRIPIYLVSNSPKIHVLRILSSLGLSGVSVDACITPDSFHHNSSLPYPTKHHPEIFYREILEKYPMHNIVLLDDSRYNLEQAKKVGIEGIQVNHQLSLEEALALFCGHILPPSSVEHEHNLFDDTQCSDDKYTFDDVQYIQHKNGVDEESLNVHVWTTLGSELKALLQVDEAVLYIHDLGAGLLSMLRLIVFGGKRVDSLLSTLIQQEPTPLTLLRYTAYESNKKLLQRNIVLLNEWGFHLLHQVDDTITFSRRKDQKVSIDIELVLKIKDFRSEEMRSHSPHLIVGCCFADLFSPEALVASVLRLITLSLESKPRKVLTYFPITFTGTTQFVPSMPYDCSTEETLGGRTVPSDTLAFQMYKDHLEHDYGHSTDILSLIDEFKRFGAKVICVGESNWQVHPKQHGYLWQTLLYFFGLSAAPDLLKGGWNSRGWIKRARSHKPSINVSNKDLLLSMNNVESVNKSHIREEMVFRDELWFIGPRSVRKVREEQTSFNLKPLQPGYVEVRSMYSLISSGTELKIFKGNFEEAPLDVTIESMKEMAMRYPLQYGYSLVGVVTRCASDVADSSALLGKYVFTFSPHCSLIRVHRKSIYVIPHGVRAEDAIFLPSVETALSIVHDAKLNDGESVAIMGQGLIGLLINAILSQQRRAVKYSGHTSEIFNSVTVFDTSTERLLVASAMGADQCLQPAEVGRAGSFDVCIEVSGNPHALQSAIDKTKSGGRVVVASWYGDMPVSLKLGMDFHRSHKTIIASQVSLMPAPMTALWSKERRFQLAWELLRSLKPSRLITKIVNLDQAQDAYELLEKGHEIAVAFKY